MSMDQQLAQNVQAMEATEQAIVLLGVTMEIIRKKVLVIFEYMQAQGFFSALSQSLWTIDKHPFSKIGNLNKGGESRELSYDPSRVFKKFQDEDLDHDPEYLEFEREERFNELHLEKNLLVTEMQQRQEKLRVKASEILRPSREIYNPFVHQRERCTLCSDCELFEGNFRKNKVGKVDVFCCLNCRCPMNAHRVVVRDQLFSSLVYSHLKDKDINPESISTSIFFAAMAIDRKKKSVGLGAIINLLGEGGYTVLSFETLTKEEFHHKMVQQRLFSHKNRYSSLNDFEEMHNFVQSLDHQRGKSREEGFAIEERMPHGRKYRQLRKEVATNFPLQNQEVLCLLINSPDTKRKNFDKFMATVATLGFLESLRCVYTSTSNYSSVIGCQVFFPSYSKVNYEVLVSPSTDNKASFSLKDMLDLNEYVVLRDGFESVSRLSIERAFDPNIHSHLVPYILGKHVASETVPFVDIKIAAKMGVPELHTFGQPPPFLRFQEEREVSTVMQSLCPKSLQCQRCVIVMRPALTSSGMDNLVLNFFRINGFNILGRTYASMTPHQIRLMQILEGIAEEDRPHYAEMMQGLVEIVLVSKRMAISESSIIANGCCFGLKKLKTRAIREQPQFRVEINQKEYIQQLHLSEPRLWEQADSSVFNGVKHLFNVEALIFGKDKRAEATQLVQTATGNVIREQHQQPSRHKINPKLREAILQDLNSQMFNFWVYTSISETITEQIVNEFLPECSAYESICLILKPGSVHLSSQVKKCLKSLRYTIIFEKTLILSRLLAKEIVESLFVSNSPELLRSLTDKYSTEKVEFICVGKESARKEMMYFLRNFGHQDVGEMKETESLSDSVLSQVLVPVWQEEHLVLQLFHPILQDVERSISDINKLERQDLFNLMTYLVGSIAGQEVLELPLKTKIGELSYLVLSNVQDAKLQSWYFSRANHICPLFVPSLFQYRQFGATVFCLQSHIGEELFKCIFRAYVQNKNALTKGGKSLVLYLWAKKLADMVSALSEMKPEVAGFGEIQKFGDVYRGVTLDDVFKVEETKKVRGWAKKWIGKNEEIVRHLERSLDKRGFAERCKLKHKRLLPSIHDGHLRAVKSSRLSKLILKDEIQLIDPNNELTKSVQLLTIHLYNTLPHQRPKYRLWCEVYCQMLRYTSSSNRFNEPAQQFLELFIQVSNRAQFDDLEMLAVELYLTIVEKYLDGEEHLEHMLGVGLLDFKRLGRLNQVDDTSGKKRKFIPKSDTRGKQEPLNYLLETTNKFNEYVYNVYSDAPKPDEGSLYDRKDPLHRTWANEKRMVNLIRETSPERQPRKGIYVQYEKKMNQNEEEVKRRIQEQANKYLDQEEKILYDQETGDKKIWYRKKYESSFKPSGKMDDAIQKQLEKLMQFKEK